MSNNSSLNRFFSGKVFGEIINTGHNDVYDYVVRRYIENPEKKTNEQIISEIYTYLGKSNRNEYYYMNTLLNKLLVGIHNVNTTTALSQLRIGKHIADFVMINGEGVVYEIKSDLDNLDRLNRQIEGYYKAFSKVAVLISSEDREHAAEELEQLGEMGNSVGIYVLSNKDTIFDRTHSREPKEYCKALDYFTLFSVLRKREYEHILMEFFGTLPEAKPVDYYKRCCSEFERIPIIEAKKMVHSELKKRNRIDKEMFEDIPMELKGTFYFGNFVHRFSSIKPFLRQYYCEEVE